MPRHWHFFLIKSLGYILAIQMINLYGAHATVPYVPTPQFGTVGTRKMAGLVQYCSYVLYNRCDDCEHWSRPFEMEVARVR
jgi:hypothetical protein